MRILYALVAEEHYHGVKDKSKLMKANEAPEKLYIDTEDRLSDSILYGFTQKRKGNDIEYIRKDIFIEKACKWFRDIDYDDSIPPFETTEEFIEGFKNAMKGE